MKDYLTTEERLNALNPTLDRNNHERTQTTLDAKAETNNQESDCLTEKEAAVYINMSRSFLRATRMNGSLRRRGSVPPFLRNGRTIRYLKSDLDGWLHSLRVIPHSIDEY